MAQEAIVVSLKHATQPWTVIHAIDVKDLLDQALSLFPNEVGPILQKRDPDPIWVIAVMQDAYTNKMDAAISHFAKRVVEDRLGGRDVDEDPETDNRSRRRSRDDDEPAPRRESRRYNGDDDEDERPARRSRSYGDDADEPDNAPRCDHGKMKRLEGVNKEGKSYAGWACDGNVSRDEQCPAKWDKKSGGGNRGGYNRR